jgi:hypothetical protein
VIRFDSIISRIVILHVIAVAITSILMSVALSWLLSMATTNIHNDAMEEQAVSLAAHLVLESDGRLSLALPPNLQGFYSQPYGRYSYAVIDDNGRTLFSGTIPRDPQGRSRDLRRQRPPLDRRQDGVGAGGRRPRQQ